VCVFQGKKKSRQTLSRERHRTTKKIIIIISEKKRDVNVNLATLTRERKRVEPKYLWNFFFLVGKTLCAAVIVIVTTPSNHLTPERKRANMWNVRFISAPNGN
jgi:hypothetical protein